MCEYSSNCVSNCTSDRQRNLLTPFKFVRASPPSSLLSFTRSFSLSRSFSLFRSLSLSRSLSLLLPPPPPLVRTYASRVAVTAPISAPPCATARFTRGPLIYPIWITLPRIPFLAYSTPIRLVNTAAPALPAAYACRCFPTPRPTEPATVVK